MRDFLGGPVSKTLHSLRWRPGFDPWSGKKIPYVANKSSHAATKDPTCCKWRPKILRATTKTWCNQIKKWTFIKKVEGRVLDLALPKVFTLSSGQDKKQELGQEQGFCDCNMGKEEEERRFSEQHQKRKQDLLIVRDYNGHFPVSQL